jgi:sulfate transport system permease protein
LWPAFSYTTLYLTLIVLIPLSAVFLKSFTVSWTQFLRTILVPPVLAAYKLSFGAALVAGAISAIVGFLVAWVLVRYEFQGNAIADAPVDLPFALPTAVVGIALTSLYTEGGWVGRYLAPLGIKVAFTPLGIIVALTFIGLPFVIRSVQPVLEDADQELEEAAASLGASRWQTLRSSDLADDPPRITDGIRVGVRTRAGRYGSVIFISGNLPMKTQIARRETGAVRLRRSDRHRRRDARRVVCLAARHQRAAEAHGQVPGEGAMTLKEKRMAADPRPVRLLLTALATLGLFVALPLVACSWRLR